MTPSLSLGQSGSGQGCNRSVPKKEREIHGVDFRVVNWLFPGSKVLIILRDVGVRDVRGIGPKVCYAFLGECYLHGVMDGEGRGNMFGEK